jgi:hypothetical protein
MTRALSAAAAAVAAAMLLAACGDGNRSAQSGLPANSALITNADVDKYKPHTPERTFMAWWRAIQYTDGRTYLSLLSTPLRNRRRQDKAHRDELPIVALQLTPARPHIKRLDIRGDSATLYAEIEFRSLVGADKYSSTRRPQAFPMVREGKEWRMADDLFVEAAAAPELLKRQRLAARAGVLPQSPTSAPTQTPATPAPATPAPTQTPATPTSPAPNR